MGITNVTLESFEKTIKSQFLQGLSGKHIKELGDQQIYISGKEQVLFKTYSIFDGSDFLSIDIHGLNEVLKLDFREELPIGAE